MRRWLAALTIGIAVALLCVFTVSAATCPPSPFAGLEQNRWTIRKARITVNATVLGEIPSSGGAYWLVINATIDDGTTIMGRTWIRNERIWAKVYPDKYPVSRPFTGETVTITGPLVRDNALEAIFSDAEIVPVMHLERQTVRDYNEQRASGWWHVWQLKDGTYRDSLIAPRDYAASGISLMGDSR